MSDKWEWFGYAQHLIVARSCHFHLATRINGRYLVSTVGDYRPGDKSKMESIGSNEGDYFETFVFNCTSKMDSCGCCPEIESYEELDGRRSSYAWDAQRIHLEYCEKYSKEQS